VNSATPACWPTMNSRHRRCESWPAESGLDGTADRGTAPVAGPVQTLLVTKPEEQQAPGLCPGAVGRVVAGVHDQHTPLGFQTRRISWSVDLPYAAAQPLHYSILVRSARSPEKLDRSPPSTVRPPRTGLRGAEGPSRPPELAGPNSSGPLDEPTWLTEGFKPRRKRGTSPAEWRCLWSNPRSP
jgi:hypothetical protein